MNVMNKIAVSSMKKNRTRTLASLIGIIISAAIFMAIATLAVSLCDFMIQREVGNNGNYFTRFYFSDADDLSALRSDKRVKEVSAYGAIGFASFENKESNWSSFAVASGDESFYKNMPVYIKKGRLPENSSEIIITEKAEEVLSFFGYPYEIGDEITVEMTTVYEDGADLPETEERSFSEKYTIVGVYDGISYNGRTLLLDSFLTFSDGNEGDALWYQLFAVTRMPFDAEELASESYGAFSSVNHNLLGYYGLTEYSNYNLLIFLFAAVLILIVTVGTVSLIYNSFSISVSERTRDFGLLSGVGATGKQIRASVYAEALTLCGIGIPTGTAFGYIGIAITLSLLSKKMALLFAPGDNDIIKIYAVFSFAALFVSVMISFFTVLISVSIPAKRASRITPIEAVRGNKEYGAVKKARKGRFLSQGSLGIHFSIAKKYYGASSRRYRATVLSLAVSIALFMSAVSLSSAMRESIQSAANVKNYDFKLYISSEDELPELEEIRSNPVFTKSSRCKTVNKAMLVSEDMLSDGYNEAWEKMLEYYGEHDYHGSFGGGCWFVDIFYVEDSVLSEFLDENGLDKEKYLGEYALFTRIRMITPMFKGEDGKWKNYNLTLDPIRKGTGSVYIMDRTIPEELYSLHSDHSWRMLRDNGYTLYQAMPAVISEDGTSYFDVDKAVYYELSEEGGTVAYYPFDVTKRERTGDAVLRTDKTLLSEYKLGECVETVPFGMNGDVSNAFTLIKPLSSLDGSAYSGGYISLKTDNYYAARAYLDSKNVSYEDYRAEEENARTMLLILDVFAYGFIILVSLISLANVINTVSTNIALRKRDFAMIRSVGLEHTGIYRIVGFECLMYGTLALVSGLPAGILMHYLIYRIESGAVISSFSIPWNTVCVALLCVIGVTAISSAYAVSKLKKADIAEDLKDKNT